MESTPSSPQKHQRRPRYKGTHPRSFHEKYKELDPSKDPETVAKIIASGKTPAGTHRPIMVREIIKLLAPQAGETFVDATLGYGGHSSQILPLLLPGGKLIGIDQDPLELPKTEARLRALLDKESQESLFICQSNFAALPKALTTCAIHSADMILADLGCSSMQFDNPERGFSYKLEGPLDLRMNPQKGIPASEWLSTLDAETLEKIFVENSDEPFASALSRSILQCHSQTPLATTTELSDCVLRTLPLHLKSDEKTNCIRRVFQAIRIEINSEFQVLESFLRTLPYCLKPGGRVAVLTFHSGEDRRVKHAFQNGLREGHYTEVAREVLRPTSEEIHSNPRASSAKLRWAIK